MIGTSRLFDKRSEQRARSVRGPRAPKHDARRFSARAIALFLIAGLVAAAASHVWGDDVVRAIGGRAYRGKITAMNPTQIVVELGKTRREISVGEVDQVAYDDEPKELTEGRDAVRAAKYREGLALLDAIGSGDVKRAEIRHDIEFYQALAAARLALAGQGSIADAGRKMQAFDRNYRQSFHHFEASEVLGDLLSALEKFDEAETYYDRVAAAPWPNYKVRATVRVGQTLLGQRRYPQALAKFNEVLDSRIEVKGAERELQAARLGRAAALAGSGQAAQAIDAVQQVLAQANPADMEIQARAYNTLGTAYQAADHPREALMAFLHVDLLCSRFGQQHAEALAHLAKLWEKLDQPDRAAEASRQLKAQYPESSWAR